MDDIQIWKLFETSIHCVSMVLNILPLSGSDDESDEESSDESDWSESEEETDSEAGGYDLDVCPPGCDQALYDSTCALREKRCLKNVLHEL